MCLSLFTTVGQSVTIQRNLRPRTTREPHHCGSQWQSRALSAGSARAASTSAVSLRESHADACFGSFSARAFSRCLYLYSESAL